MGVVMERRGGVRTVEWIDDFSTFILLLDLFLKALDVVVYSSVGCLVDVVFTCRFMVFQSAISRASF